MFPAANYSTGSVALVYIAALAASGTFSALTDQSENWVAGINVAPAYEVDEGRPTYSSYRSLGEGSVSSDDFGREIASIYAMLSESQEPLGADFEAVWDANVDSLYEA